MGTGLQRRMVRLGGRWPQRRKGERDGTLMLRWKSALHADEDCVSRGWSRPVGGIPTQIIPAAEALRGEQSQLGGPWAQM